MIFENLGYGIVYAYFKGDECLYVGKSTGQSYEEALQKRHRGHLKRKNQFGGRTPFDKFLCFNDLDEIDLYIVERVEIKGPEDSKILDDLETRHILERNPVWNIMKKTHARRSRRKST